MNPHRQTTGQDRRDEQMRAMIREDSAGRLPGHAYGGSEIHYITADLAILCHRCANRENGSEAYIGHGDEPGDDAQWHIVDHAAHWEGPALECAHCYREILSEYGNPSDDDEDQDHHQHQEQEGPADE